MKSFVISCGVLFLFVYSEAQQFGGNPPSVKWKQLNTDTARVIYPAGLDVQAQRVASVVHYLAAQKPISLGNQLRKINIVLQGQTIIPNAYVGLGPFRSEFYLTTPSNNFDQGSLNWIDQLSVHEYRHVQQYNNFNNGLSRFMYHLFGEEGFDLAINASIPNWLYEGDAVFNETILTNQGRGRIPYFLNEYNALWQAGKQYSWMKLRNGSLKDFVPNHYPLGYLLVNYGREKYGADFWTKVTHDASAFKNLFYPFQKAIQKYAGVDYKTFYTNAFDYYKKMAGVTADKEIASQGTINQGETAGIKSVFPVNEKYVTDYMFPYQAGQDSVVYLKTSYRQLPAFYIKDKTGEHKIRTRDIALDDQFSYRNGKIVYAAYESDPRWGWRDYSVIRLLDIQTGEQRTITSRTKYFTPDISANGSLIAAVQNTVDGKSELHILSTTDGKLVQKIKAKDIAVFSDPKFLNENTIITPVRLTNGKMCLAWADIATGKTERLTVPSYNVIGFPCVYDSMVYFTASYLGNDNLFKLRLSDRKVFLVKRSLVGDYFVNASTDKIYYSAFTADGYQLKEMNQKNESNEEPVDSEQLASLQPEFPVSLSSGYKDILLDSVQEREFQISKYRQATKLLNFHSWRPYYEDPEFTFSLYGENVLNTLQTQVYYLYNQNEKTNAVGFSTVYGEWFPYLSAGLEYTFDRQALLNNNTTLRFSQLDARAGLSIPLSWAKGKTFSNFSIGTSYYLQTQFYKNYSTSSASFSYLYHYINWSQQSQMAKQQIYPRAAYAISLNHRYPISRYKGYQFLGNASVYLPGIANTHTIVVNGAFQQRDTTYTLFSNLFANARGYSDVYLSRMWKLSGNYHFPIFIPDWGFGNILYLQRIRGNVFYDFTKVYSKDKTLTRNQRSVGGEIYIDTKWWNQYPLTFGFRVSHLLDNDLVTGGKGMVYEFILPVSILPK